MDKRFANIVIRANFKALDDVLDGIFGGHKNQRSFVAFGTQFGGKLKAVDVGHGYVKDQQVGFSLLDHLHGTTSIVHGFYFVPFFAQHKLDQGIGKAIIINNKNIHSQFFPSLTAFLVMWVLSHYPIPSPMLIKLPLPGYGTARHRKGFVYPATSDDTSSFTPITYVGGSRLSILM